MSAIQKHVPEVDWLVKSGRGEGVLLVIAHPDDEVIGAGGLLSELPDCNVLHVTDGAPRRTADSAAKGFATPAEYAAARREELLAALAVAGLSHDRCFQFGVPDQEASFRLTCLVERLTELLQKLRPESVLTQPYEGGHPDHDATAFAVQMACRRLELESIAPPTVFEMTSYHNSHGQMSTFEFLPREGCPVLTRILSRESRRLKRQMMDCFKTQKDGLRWFQVTLERFRPAPCYDFTVPPHPGPLFYEYFDRGITGEDWRALACEAVHGLGLDRSS